MLTPPPAFVEVGAPLPPEADAVLPPDAVTMHGGSRTQRHPRCRAMACSRPARMRR